MDELDILRKNLRAQMNNLSDEIIGGAASDFADYRHMVGVVEGLALAERELLDLKERLSTHSE
ncbi:hypothetical protein UFOVP28_30 [uncultured Caudovirales phage]|uniref:Uncharacterized protein n=1 Tax=uncultured Caudovirales phage TaxID=2100421 RepID=A0A6J5KN80_9CAUD|nr:hypothetical protein UFOVP28_30 [uncultured Caudovirales phage]